MKRSIAADAVRVWFGIADGTPPAECACPNTTGALTVQECLPDGTGCSIPIKVTDAPEIPETCVAEFPYCVLCVRRTAGSSQTVTWTLDPTKGRFRNGDGLTITPRGADFAFVTPEESQKKVWTATTNKSPGQRTTLVQVLPKIPQGHARLPCKPVPAYIINTEMP